MRVRAGAAAILAVVLVGGGTAASAIGPASPPAASTPAMTGTGPSTVTLITGDRVTFMQTADAPGADLLVGKVLTDDGRGEMSWVIDGMEWAAGAGADIVNLSLGENRHYSDGTDPGSLAVDALSTAPCSSSPRATTGGWGTGR